MHRLDEKLNRRRNGVKVSLGGRVNMHRSNERKGDNRVTTNGNDTKPREYAEGI